MAPTKKTENTAAAKAIIKTYSIADSSDTMELAKDLKRFISENKLYQNIQGKEFVNVEGWQYAGSRLGIVPVLGDVKNISTEGDIKYEARVSLYDVKLGITVGGGLAVCSNKEQGKKFYQEFAIASMAQTRAVGKAYRNLLAWIIRAAGYEPTPAEEMDYAGNEPAPAAAKQQEVKQAAAPAQQAAAAPTGEPAGNTPAQVVKYATAHQKEEIIRLLNNPMITRDEKTKMLLNVNKLDEERASQVIAKLGKVIDDRTLEADAADNTPENN